MFHKKKKKNSRRKHKDYSEPHFSDDDKDILAEGSKWLTHSIQITT